MSSNLSQNLILENALNYFLHKTNLVPKIGVELEFYLFDANSNPVSQIILDFFINQISLFFLNDSSIYKIEKEQGISQIEIKISPSKNLIELAKKIENIKFSVKNLALKNNLIANFDSLPILEDCGSALQFNFSLHDNFDKNLFCFHDKIFLATIAGMLDSIESSMNIFAPNKKDYLRFDLEINRNLYKKGKFTAPTHICFGLDNRTAAIRFFSENNSQKRIEFRVACADANPFLSIATLLFAIADAISIDKTLPDIRIYGNAFDDQYRLKKIIAG